MKAFIDIIGLLDFTCPLCGHSLTLSESNVALLIHPDRTGGLSGGKFKVNCTNAGKQFVRPTVDLEEYPAQ